MTKAKIGTWGKSLAVRVPADVVRLAGLSDGEAVEIEWVDGNILMRRDDAKSARQRDALAAGVLGVHVVQPDAATSNNFQVWAGVNQVLAHLGGAAHDDDVVAGQYLGQLFLRHFVGLHFKTCFFEQQFAVRVDAVVGENLYHFGKKFSGVRGYFGVKTGAK